MECICVYPLTSIFRTLVRSVDKQLEQVTPSLSPLTSFYFKSEDNEDEDLLTSEAFKALGEKDGDHLCKHLWKCREENQTLQQKYMDLKKQAKLKSMSSLSSLSPSYLAEGPSS